MTFWEHLEELRGVLIKSVCAWLLASIAAFALKEPLFTFLFAPLGSGHTLVNLDVTAQFLTHVQVSLCIGFVIALPLVITWLFAFIAPALENNSKCSTILFIAGAFQWISNFVVSSTFVPLYNYSHSMVYIIYGVICLAAALFVWKLVPETKGKTLEQITTMWREKSKLYIVK